MPGKKLGAMYVSQMGMKVTPLDQVLTVDCGDNTGWAFWTKEHGPQEPAMHGQITLGSRASKWAREKQLAFLWAEFGKLPGKFMALGLGRPKTVVLESLEAWGTNEASLAAVRSGSLFKLAYLIGGYAHSALMWGAEYELILAREWKGQMDKEATRRRVAAVTGQHYATEHITDAVGIGLARMGTL